MHSPKVNRLPEKPAKKLLVLSVIIPNYNSGNLLGLTLESIRSQSFLSYEVIVIDGGSLDVSLQTIKNNQDIIDYWTSEPDKGIYDAMNKGSRIARGEWLYFLGAGDTLADSDILKRIFAREYSVDFLYGNVKGPIVRNEPSIYDGRFSKWKMMHQNICHQAIFYRRALVEKKGFFNQKYRILADWAFNLKCFGDPAIRILYNNEIVANFYGNGVSSRSQLDQDVAFEKEKLQLIRQDLGIFYLLCFQLKRKATHLWRKFFSS